MDILIGGSGDDTLVSSGGDDHLHGGPGQDRAVLPGSSNTYVITRDGPRLIADGPDGRVQMAGIEFLAFEALPDQFLPVSEF